MSHSWGAEEIARERRRQMALQAPGEAWTAEHDDEHTGGTMAAAAACYAAPYAIACIRLPDGLRECDGWPWDAEWDKRMRRPLPRGGDDPVFITIRIRELAKAGALIAAEIDRLYRLHGCGDLMRVPLDVVERVGRIGDWGER